MPETHSTSSGQAKKKVAPKAKKTASTGSAQAAKKAAPSGDFAVFSTGGKQYKVSEGSTLRIEKLKGDHKEGDKLTFDQVLLIDGSVTKIGTPTVSGSKVEATLEKIGRAQKVTVIKYKQKSRYFKKNGHRQPFFQIKVTGIK